MSTFQGSLEQLFQGQSFGPREGLTPLAWQSEIKAVYQDSVANFVESIQENGHPSQHVFPFFAGTATGKTNASGLMASYLLNRNLVDQVFFCCPNTNVLHKTINDYRRYLGIHLAPLEFKDHKNGIPRGFNGVGMTYPHLFKIWDNEKARAKFPVMFGGRPLVTLDEVHHLLEEEAWGRAVLAAFANAPFVISMTGTPFNSKKGRFAYCTYKECEDTEKTGLYRLDAKFNYSLGKAVVAGIVRKPHFIFSGRMEDGFEVTKVKVRVPPNFEDREVTFEEKLDDTLSRLRLNGAVVYGSISRKTFLKNALALCEEDGKRRSAIFLGGDSKGDTTATEDAMQFLPSELHELGYTDDDIAIIVGGNKNKNPHKEVNEFRKSSKRILICINMLSEGVDIPELSAAIFLTAVTAKQTTIQRIGRAIRLMDPHKTALIFMFADPAYISIAEEIEADITAEEVRLGRKTPVDRTPPSDGKFRRAEAIGISGGNLTTAMFNGQEDRVAAYKETQRRLKAKKLPWTFMHAALELLGVTNVTS